MDEKRCCGDCCYRSDGINTLSVDYCYCHDMTVNREGICSEHRSSLRSEPLAPAPEPSPEAVLMRRVLEMDNEEEG